MANKEVPAVIEVNSLGVPDNTVINTNSYDHLIYMGIRDASTKVVDLIGNNKPVDSLVSDIYSSFYKLNPEIKKEASGLSKSLIETLHKLPEFNTLRESTKLDDICSAIGMMKLAPNLVEQFKRIKEKMDNDKRNANSLSGNPDPNAEADLSEFSDELGDAVRQSIRKSIQQAQADVENWEDTCSGWGIKSGDLSNLPYDQKLKIAEQLKNRKDFKQIADLAGRFRNLALSAAAVTPSHGTDEIVDIVQGDDISRMLPVEFLKLKRTPALFMKDLLERKLLQYNLKGVENVGHGPIIVCLDISASMSGKREIWSKSVIIALMALAERQKRSIGVITFDVKARYSKFFPKDSPISIQDKITIASIVSNGGGTDFYHPLKSAFEMQTKEIQQLKPADIVFITDGECRLSENQIREIKILKDQRSTRILGIHITNSSVMDDLDDSVLSKFSDNLVSVNSLGNIEHVKGIMAKTASLTTAPKKDKVHK